MFIKETVDVISSELFFKRGMRDSQHLTDQECGRYCRFSSLIGVEQFPSLLLKHNSAVCKSNL